MTEIAARQHKIPADLERAAQRLAATGPPWLRELRRTALARFEHSGFPTADLEAWKNTNLGPLAGTAFVCFPETTFDGARLPGPAALDLGGPRLVFVNGRLAAELSSPSTTADGVQVVSLAQALRGSDALVRSLFEDDRSNADHPFLALNGALHEDGALVHVPDGVCHDPPIHLVFVSTPDGGGPAATHPRSMISVGANAQARVVESHVCVGRGTYLTNPVSVAHVGAGARVDHYRIQDEGDEAYHVSWGISRQQRDSRYRTFSFDFGGRLVRHDLRAVLDGEGGNCEMDGLYMPYRKQHMDNHTSIDHARPNCDSRELYKGVLGGHGRSVFNGRIIVREDAQKTDAKQSNPNLLLSDHALAHTRPQLEIYADDVKCTHGATIGRLDEEAIFYLRSRGIPQVEASNLMISAYAGEVLEHVEIEPLREHLERRVEERLQRMKDGGS